MNIETASVKQKKEAQNTTNKSLSTNQDSSVKFADELKAIPVENNTEESANINENQNVSTKEKNIIETP